MDVSSILLTCVLGLVLYASSFVVQFLLFRRRIAKATKDVPPIGPIHPIWGNVPKDMSITRVQEQLFDAMVKTKKKMFTFWRMFILPIVFTTHPDTAKVLLKSSFPKQTRYGQGYATILPWIGYGLLTSAGKKWERNRRLLTPAFHFDVLRPYMRIYNGVSKQFIEKMQKESKCHKSIEVFDPIGLLTLDTMLRCAFSYEGNIQGKGNTHPYVQAVKQLAKGTVYRSMRPYLAPYWLFKLTEVGREFAKNCDYVHDFAEKIIKDRREKLEKDSSLLQKRHLDFLDILITARDETGEGLTNQEIRDEVDTFLFEGHDTTSSALSWSLYCLGQYQDEQNQVYKEVEELFADKNDLEWSDLQQMPLLTAFAKEAMRLYPPVPGISRVLTEDVDIDGVKLCKGTIVAISIRQIHKNPEVWPNSDKFMLERFLETDKSRDAYSFVPFSAGPRNCIGQHFAMDEIKVVLAHVLKNFRVLPVPDHEPRPIPELILRSSNGIKVSFEPR